MDKVIVSNTTIKFNFSLKELVENYRRYMNPDDKVSNQLEGPFICCWIAYMCVEGYVPGTVIVSPGPRCKNVNLRWDMFDTDVTSDQFMNQWIDKVNPEGNRVQDTLFHQWNKGTKYAIREFPVDWYSDDNRDAYRLKALEFALELNPNVEFEIGMKLEKYYNFVVDTL